MTREELATQASLYREENEEWLHQLNDLRRMKEVKGLNEGAYDWLAMEIAQTEREMYGRELS